MATTAQPTAMRTVSREGERTTKHVDVHATPHATADTSVRPYQSIATVLGRWPKLHEPTIGSNHKSGTSTTVVAKNVAANTAAATAMASGVASRCIKAARSAN